MQFGRIVENFVKKRRIPEFGIVFAVYLSVVCLNSKFLL